MNVKTNQPFKFLTHYSFILALSIILLLMWNLTALVQTVSSIYNQTQPKFATTEFQYLVDRSAQKDVNEIVTQLDKFETTSSEGIPFTMANLTYWINIQINNAHWKEQQIILFADNNFLENFDIYLIDAKQQRIIEHVSKPQGTLFDLFPHVELTLPTKEVTEVLVRISSNGPPSIPIKILSPDAFETITSFSKVIYGIFIGGVLVIALYNLVLFVALKDIVYVTYVGYLLTALLIMSAITGFSHLILIPELQHTLKNNMMLLHYCLMICLLMFTILFLRYDPKKSLIFKAICGYCLFLVIFFAFTSTLSHEVQTKWFFSLMPVSYLIGLTALFIRIKSRFVWAKYYVLSWVPLLIGSIVQPLVLIGAIDSSYVTRNAFLFGVFFEIILMSLALAERIRRLEHERHIEITYHPNTKLPRKNVLEHVINDYLDNKDQSLAVMVISPAMSSSFAYSIEYSKQLEFIKRTEIKLNSLFRLNNAVLPILDNKQKVALIDHNKFAIVLDKTKADQPLDILSKSIQHIIADTLMTKKDVSPLTCHIGVASYPIHGITGQSLISKAVSAAKNAELSLNTWQEYQGNTQSEFDKQRALAIELKHAITHNTLTIYHQPQVDLKTRKVCSSESLARWFHPTNGEIPPETFIPLAEQFGLMNELTLWVLKTAFKQQSILVSQQTTSPMISVNISLHDLIHEQFLLNVIDIIESSDITADKVVFEVDGDLSLSSNERALYTIQQLQEIGITISTNCFGYNYTELAKSGQSSFQELKIDHEITEDIESLSHKQAIATGLIALAKGLNMEVVAEGIINEKQEQYLRDIGCDIGQGFFYAKPMTIDDYLYWLSQLKEGRASHTIEGELITE